MSKTIDLRDVGEHRIKGRGLVLTIDERKHDDHIFVHGDVVRHNGTLYDVLAVEMFGGGFKRNPHVGLLVKLMEGFE